MNQRTGIVPQLIILLVAFELYSYIFYNAPLEFFQDGAPDVRTSVNTARRHYKSSLSLLEIDELTEAFCKDQEIFKLSEPLGERIVLLVPYRDRKEDLLAFLFHMTAYMRIKRANYEVVIIEQSNGGRFNRAKLFNAALREIFKAESSDRLYLSTCFAFHDVDKIPISLKIPYRCHFRPIQLLRYVHYEKGGKQMYRNTLGGITLFTKDHLEAMNGASNSFEGWGCEDEDLYKRVFYIHQRPLLVRFDEGQFYEERGAIHARDKSQDRYKVLARSSPQSMLEDGLQQVQYTLVERRDFDNFIWMHFII